MFLLLQRQLPQGEWLRGKLYSLTPNPSPEGEGSVKKTLLGETLERTSKAILPLVYPVEVTMSPKFKRLLPIVCNVPSRSGIRFHRGSRPEHSLGCILVTPDVEQSLTQLLLEVQRNHEEIRLEVAEYLPEYTDEECPAGECAPYNP